MGSPASAHAIEMAGNALARNSVADRAARERRIAEESHAAENERFLATRTDDIAEWLANGDGQSGIDQAQQAVFDGKTRVRFLRSGDLGAAQRMAYGWL